MNPQSVPLQGLDLPEDLPGLAVINDRWVRRAHLPILMAFGLLDETVAVPWWNGKELRMIG